MNDVRFAFRQLLKAPAFSVIAVATLALGIGVNSALFNVVNSILFRSPGYADPSTLVDVYETSPGFRYSTTSYPDYKDVRDRNQVFSGVALYQLQALGFSRGDLTRTVWAEVVSGNYFSVLGVPAVLGRTFDAVQHDVPGAPPVAVLSHGFWQKEFGADPRVIGTTIRLNGAAVQVLGVASPEFKGMIRGLRAEVWVPAAATALIFPGSSFFTNRGNHNSFMRARLKPGITAAQAATDMAGIAARLGEIYPETNKGRDLLVVPTAQVTLNPQVDGMVAGASLGLMAVPAMVLLIACANLATLFLTRATGRSREIAVRMALGASRREVVRGLLAESLLLSAAGGILGLLICFWLSELLVRFQPPIPVPLSLDISVDWRVVAFTAAISVVTGVVFGLAPALRATRTDLVADLREGARGSSTRSRLRSGLVVVQLAVSVVLLVGSALLLRGLGGAARVNMGFNPNAAGTLVFDPAQQGYSNERSLALLEQLIGRARALPGVVEVSSTSRPPLNLNVSTNEIMVEGRPVENGQYPEIQRASVAPGYVKAIGAVLSNGRDFTPRDREGQPLVVVVNETAARLLWPGQSALGRRIAGRTSGGEPPWREVVGVVKDIKVTTIGERPTAQIFYPVLQFAETQFTLIARTTGDPARTAVELRRLLKELDPTVPVMASGPLVDQVTTALFPVRFAAMLLTVLGLAGVAIAAIGLYGTIAQGVAARTRELGIRIALGADPRLVRRMVLIDGLKLATVGLAAGLVIAALASQVLGTWLYGVSPYDPLAFVTVPLLLLLVAVTACLIPARRATRVDPVNALRVE